MPLCGAGSDLRSEEPQSGMKPQKSSSRATSTTASPGKSTASHGHRNRSLSISKKVALVNQGRLHEVIRCVRYSRLHWHWFDDRRFEPVLLFDETTDEYVRMNGEKIVKCDQCFRKDIEDEFLDEADILHLVEYALCYMVEYVGEESHSCSYRRRFKEIHDRYKDLKLEYRGLKSELQRIGAAHTGGGVHPPLSAALRTVGGGATGAGGTAISGDRRGHSSVTGAHRVGLDGPCKHCEILEEKAHKYKQVAYAERRKRVECEQRVADLQSTLRRNTEEYQRRIEELEDWLRRAQNDRSANKDDIRRDRRELERLEHAKAQADADQDYLRHKIDELEKELRDRHESQPPSGLESELSSLKRLINAELRIEKHRVRGLGETLRSEKKSLERAIRSLRRILSDFGEDPDSVRIPEVPLRRLHSSAAGVSGGSSSSLDDSGSGSGGSSRKSSAAASRKKTKDDSDSMRDDRQIIDEGRLKFPALDSLDQVLHHSDELYQNVMRLRSEKDALMDALLDSTQIKDKTEALMRKEEDKELNDSSFKEELQNINSSLDHFINRLHLKDDLRVAAGLFGSKQWNHQMRRELEKQMDCDLSTMFSVVQLVDFHTDRVIPTFNDDSYYRDFSGKSDSFSKELFKLNNGIELMQLVICLMDDCLLRSACSAIKSSSEYGNNNAESSPLSYSFKADVSRRLDRKQLTSNDDASGEGGILLRSLEELIREHAPSDIASTLSIRKDEPDLHMGPLSVAYSVKDLQQKAMLSAAATAAIVGGKTSSIDSGLIMGDVDDDSSRARSIGRKTSEEKPAKGSSSSSSLEDSGDDSIKWSPWLDKLVKKVENFIQSHNIDHDLEMIIYLFFSENNGELNYPHWWQPTVLEEDDRHLSAAPAFVKISKTTMKSMMESLNKLINCVLFLDTMVSIINDTLNVPRLQDDQISKAIEDGFTMKYEQFNDLIDFSDVNGNLARLIGMTALSKLWSKDDALARDASLRVLCTYIDKCFNKDHGLVEVDWTALYETLLACGVNEDAYLQQFIDHLFVGLNVANHDNDDHHQSGGNNVKHSIDLLPSRIQKYYKSEEYIYSHYYIDCLNEETKNSMVEDDSKIMLELLGNVHSKTHSLWLLKLLTKQCSEFGKKWMKGCVRFLSKYDPSLLISKKKNEDGDDEEEIISQLSKLPLHVLIERVLNLEFSSPAVSGGGSSSSSPKTSSPQRSLRSTSDDRTDSESPRRRPPPVPPSAKKSSISDEDDEDEEPSPYLSAEPMVVSSSAPNSGASGEDEIKVEDDEEDEDEHPPPELSDVDSHATVASSVQDVAEDDLLKQDTLPHKTKVMFFRSHPSGTLHGSCDIRGIIKFWKSDGDTKICNAILSSELPILPQGRHAVGQCGYFSRKGDWFAVGGSVDATEKFGVIYLFPIVSVPPSEEEEKRERFEPRKPLILKSGESDTEFSGVCSLVIDSKSNFLFAGDGNGHVHSFKIAKDESTLRKNALIHVRSVSFGSTDRVCALALVEQPGTVKNRALFASDRRTLGYIDCKSLTKRSGGSSKKLKFRSTPRDRTDALEITCLHSAEDGSRDDDHSMHLFIGSRRLVRYRVRLDSGGSIVVIEKDKSFIPTNLPSDWISQIESSNDGAQIALSYTDGTTPLPEYAVVYWKDSRWHTASKSTKSGGEVAFASTAPGMRIKGSIVLCFQKYIKSSKSKKKGGASKSPSQSKVKMVTFCKSY